MSVVKTKKINDITVNIHDDCIPKDKEEYKKNLKIFYTPFERFVCYGKRRIYFSR